MHNALEYWSSVVANITTSLKILGFIAIYINHRLTQDQFSFTVMLSCIERFQALSPFIKSNPDDTSSLRKYVDLTNEEFFYFQRKNIPKAVIAEWLDTIVDYFPLYVEGKDEPINYLSLRFKDIHDKRLLEGYPRLIKAFTLAPSVDPYVKADVIKAVAANLHIRLKDRHLKDALYLP